MNFLCEPLIVCKTFAQDYILEEEASYHNNATNSLKSDSYPPKKCVFWFNESPLKMMKNAFFHLTSLFRSQDIHVFIMTFWTCRKNGLIRKIRLISEFMMSQPGQQTIAIHILPNISWSKSNLKMKLGQLIDFNKRNIFLQKLCRKWVRETSSDLLFIF